MTEKPEPSIVLPRSGVVLQWGNIANIYYASLGPISVSLGHSGVVWCGSLGGDKCSGQTREDAIAFIDNSVCRIIAALVPEGTLDEAVARAAISVLAAEGFVRVPVKPTKCLVDAAMIQYATTHRVDREPMQTALGAVLRILRRGEA